jgi:D-alanyl-D-alanine carboxypeptidase (penicillin-binding protein 5/6)
MKNTHFENCTGLDDTTDNHLTTALDVAIMSRELLKHELITNYTTIWMDSLRNGQTELVNTNKLVRFYEGTTGLKTGTTSKAGCCVSASAKRDGTHLIAVVMGSENSTDRFETAKAMLNYGFANYACVECDDMNFYLDVPCVGGESDSITLTGEKGRSIVVAVDDKYRVKRTVYADSFLYAPIKDGQELGRVEYALDGKILATTKLVAAGNINYINKEKSIFTKIKEFFTYG